MSKRNVQTQVKDPKKKTFLFLVGMIALFTSVSAAPAQGGIEQFLPAPACLAGWTMDGKVTLYDKDTLFDRIDGEAELYFPYGFTALAYARYESKQNPNIAIDADVYTMGSQLDAFGMFANYRQKDSVDVIVGTEGTISPSQVFFYQDRYFVRLQVTGTTSLGEDILLGCARAIAKNLPQSVVRPKELEAFSAAGVIKKSERYLAQSLLGYDFFRRGLMADATVEGGTVQIFIVLEDSRDAARRAFDQYRSYLKASKKEIPVTEMADRIFLKTVDPLYGNVFVEQAGQYVIGVVRAKDSSSAMPLVEQLRKNLEGSQGALHKDQNR
ncbi:MAG TPA: DUF6599 family protein [Nitrospirota bacterium]|nr:DUF6599 family protein [Nitrospirota bacterium]